MTYYVLRKDGAYAGVSLWGGADNWKKFAIHDGTRRLEKCASLLEGESVDWPPTPVLPK
jgi:N4-(beta-N-acetylglucosaminyl)-L-asparaginase